MLLPKGVAECRKETNTHNFFFVDLAGTPTPLLPDIVYFVSSNIFFECFFSHMTLLFLGSCSAYFVIKIHIILGNVLCISFCSEEHIWEVTESSEFCELHCYLPISLPGFVWIWSGHQVHRFAPQHGSRSRRVCTVTGTTPLYRVYTLSHSLAQLLSEHDFRRHMPPLAKFLILLLLRKHA